MMQKYANTNFKIFPLNDIIIIFTGKRKNNYSMPIGHHSVDH